MENEAVADRPAEPARCRGFRVFDAMVLIAGVAVFLAGGGHLLMMFVLYLRWLGTEVVNHISVLAEHRHLFWGAVHHHLRNTLWYGFQAIEMMLVGMAPAFLAV